ncbi:MAG: hypothetical protein ABI683_01950 [Ginsengibacter sp.]
MGNLPTYFRYFFDWSEAWAPLIPIFVLLKYPKQPAFLRPVIVYILIAFPVNLFGDIIGDFKEYLPNTYWFQKNLYLYNIHSLVRFVCFTYFFLALKQPFYKAIKKVIPFLYLTAMLVDLIWFEVLISENSICSHLFTIEAFFLLAYCMIYYLSKLNNEYDAIMSGADMYVATGLSIFVVINFFIFLFYDAMIDDAVITKDFSIPNNMWSVHNIGYIVLCLFIAKAFASAEKINAPTFK